ncbi:MAG: hypothetical protein DRN14_03010 [Thermoplasmata archaeon]|nr:MAG: hypothetical protein DRN14_03010 [Thermoplasmata archaeon]
MRVVFEIKHPARVFMYGSVARILEERGHETLFVHSGRPTALRLLERMRLRHVPLPPTGGSLASRALGTLANAGRLAGIAKEFRTDFMVDGVSSALVSRILGLPHLFFFDSEPSRLVYLLVAPLTRYFVHPSSYRGPRPPGKAVEVDASKELAYLHPRRFRPSDEVFEYVGDKPYALLWKNTFTASHDISHYGFTLGEVVEIVRGLRELGLRVYAGSEGGLPAEVRRLSRPFPFPPELIHSAIYHARVVVTDAHTIAVEAAILGTPVVRYNTFVGRGDLGVLRELEEVGLLTNARTPGEAYREALRLAAEGRNNRDLARRYAEGKVDLAEFLADLIEAGGGT